MSSACARCARARAGGVQLPESAKSRGDILIPHQAGLEVIDVSITDPMAQSYVDAVAAANGAAAAARDAVKDTEYKSDVDAEVYGFTAATQEVFGRFVKGAWVLLKSMAERAEQEGRVCKETFVRNTLLHLSVALCHGNCSVLRKGLHELAKATGRQTARSASSDCRPGRLMSDLSFVSLPDVADHVGQVPSCNSLCCTALCIACRA